MSIKLVKRLRITALYVVCAVVISACGGGGGGSSQSAGIGGTGITARGYVQGKVTGFGSIFVNGIEFNTDTSEFIVDGNASATQDDLAIGMIVTLEVETSKGAYTGKAFNVVYDDEVQGPVAATPVDIGGGQKTFQVFGQTVTIDETSTLFEDAPLNPGFGFDTISNNDVVEISGFRSSPTEILASYVEWKGNMPDGSEVELRGKVVGYVPPAQWFMLDSVLITFDNMTDLELEGGVLVDGLFVEVEGIYNEGPPVSVHAEEIEEEEEGFGEEIDDVSLEGIVSNYTSISDFEINGQAIDASQAELEPANAAMLLADGIEVEVEGDIVGGVLIAEELEIEEGDAELESFVGQVNAADKWFTVDYPTAVPGSIVVRTNSETVFEDEAGPNPVEDMTIDNLKMATDYVRVEGRELNDEVVASTVKRIDVEDARMLYGQVDAHDPGVSITILGVVYQVDGSTTYDPSNAFVAGDTVEIEDEADPPPADGIADSVEVD